MDIRTENNSIFHHTSSVTTLQAILQKQAFKVQYCTEKIYLSKNTFLHIMVPMVSFADIRLTDYVRSFRQPTKEGEYALGYYGDYAIGLSKEWAIQKNVSPIIYLPKPKTTLPQNHFLKPLKGKEKRVLNDNDFGEKIDGLAPIASFCKHYEGILEKDPNRKERYAFHNEQEWRYVPSDLPIRWNLYNNKSDADYQNKKKKKEILNKKIKRKLEFDLWNDVTYIVVKSEKYIDRIVEILEKRYRKELALHPADNVKITQRFRYLCTCVITTEQLCSDL